MVGIITTAGEEWLADKAFNNVAGRIDTIALGTGTTAPAAGDTALQTEVYRGTDAQPNITFSATEQPGEYNCSITVSGGTEVASGTIITEFGVIASTEGVLVGREVFSGATIDSGTPVTFAPPLDINP